MQSTYRSRRTPEQWQQIVTDWKNSNLSAPKYCEEHQLSYASFSQWRRRFSDQTNTPTANEGFLNLSALGEQLPSSGWRITLRLGGDVELVLSRT